MLQINKLQNQDGSVTCKNVACVASEIVNLTKVWHGRCEALTQAETIPLASYTG